MPIFEYTCNDCGSRFERFVATREDAVVCKECASPRVERRLSVFAVAGASERDLPSDAGPCPCGAPRRGMCGG